MHNPMKRQCGINLNISRGFYHVSQTTWRHVQDLAMVGLYQNDDAVRKCVGMMDGIVFLSDNDVHGGVAEIRIKMINMNPWLMQLLAYLTLSTTWGAGFGESCRTNNA